MTGPQRLVVLASPGLGILDNWLPILTAARARLPTLEIVAIVPDRETLREVDPDDTVVRMLDGLTDYVVTMTVDGGFFTHGSLTAAADAAAAERAAESALQMIDAMGRLLGRRARTDGRPSAGLLRALRPTALRGTDTDLEALGGPTTRVCYDVYVHRKPSARRALAALGESPRWSLHHGIDLVAPSPRDVASPEPHLEARASLYAESERDVYAGRYGVPPDRLHVDGVPRSDPDWVARVVAASTALHATPEPGYVLVVSRPAGSSYLPWDRKVRALRDLHQVVCVERGLRLVIKPHPKEGEDGALAAALPAESEGVTWERSRAHPFHLAAGATAAVAFHSGLVVDLVDLGVPVIELIDVRGLPAHDGADAVRDARGRPMFSAFRRAGMVLPAEEADDVRSHLDRIIADRTGTVAVLRAARDAAFARVPDPIGRVTTDLLAPWPAR